MVLKNEYEKEILISTASKVCEARELQRRLSEEHECYMDGDMMYHAEAIELSRQVRQGLDRTDLG